MGSLLASCWIPLKSKKSRRHQPYPQLENHAQSQNRRSSQAEGHSIGGPSLCLFRSGSRAGNRSPAENVFVQEDAVIVKDAAVTLLLRPASLLPLLLGRTPGKRNFSKCSEATA